MALANVNIAKERCDSLEVAPIPESGIILQIRTGKRQSLGPNQSAIAKSEVEGSVHAGSTGLEGDEHVYKFHGGLDRAIHQYDANHYSDWRAEHPLVPGLFDIGGFGENLTATNMTEENVCIGDLYRIGETVLVEVSEPRNPCYKRNIRFQWPRALKRIQRTGRVG
ncbi:putative molybdenum cofactor sulfurase, pyruvate kinase-like, insert domain superfamily [Septoria linicola]|nr:putative molybdenum cofactor sulfurase, pyruvate kinase-like, insert domain superfamily [Septoria linicola]